MTSISQKILTQFSMADCSLLDRGRESTSFALIGDDVLSTIAVVVVTIMLIVMMCIMIFAPLCSGDYLEDEEDE